MALWAGSPVPPATAIGQPALGHVGRPDVRRALDLATEPTCERQPHLEETMR